MEIKEIEFSKLRHGYITIKNFLEQASGEPVNELDKRIVEDLGLFGDDNLFLLDGFVKKYELEFENFVYEKHFHSEGELFNPTDALLNLLKLPIWLPLKTLEILTLGKIKLSKPKFEKPIREVTDMTFKDLITWYIEGTYATSEQISYKLKST